MDFAGVRWLSFDCYGTLIDWETGILAAVSPILARRGVAATDRTVLERYGELEAAAERGEYRTYRDVLRLVMSGFGEAFGITLDLKEREVLAESLGRWPAFADTASALGALKKRFKLAILSNVDDDLFALSAPKLGVRPHALITAQQCRSYKPSPNNFRVLLERTSARPGELVHVAQSLYHDHVPAKAMGLRSVWINRRAGKSGGGATLPAAAAPDLELPDLASLARVAGVA